MKRSEKPPIYTPSATYRLQFNQSFTFRDATSLGDYLDELGITDIYASPFLMARPGSVHGYDVTDQSRFNPEIGDQASFLRLSAALQQRNMGLIADVVPNHMCITHPSATGSAHLDHDPGTRRGPFAREVGRRSRARR